MSTVYFRFDAHTSAEPQRSALLERLLARASGLARVTDWRAEAFRVIAPGAHMPPLAATLLRGAQLPGLGSWGCVATPVHFIAGMSRVTMAANGIVQLNLAEANRLAADFNGVFADAGTRLAVASTAELICVFDEALDVATCDPDTVAGQDVYAFQPSGTDASRVRRLMSEVEMWLFDHEVNRARVQRGQQPVTGLWLWSGGATRATVPAVHGWTAGRDPFFASFGSETQFPSAAVSGVVVCRDYPGSSTWPDVEQRWLAPAIDGLKSGRVKRLDLSASHWRFSVTSGLRLRFWRRPRPWWAWFEMEN